ncbi:hypothetical protein [Rhizobiales bacterium]|uniref:hypothetical protein n=1 Tax=Ensifer sp. R-19 TaxID=3404055 RepID=UPI000DE47CDA
MLNDNVRATDHTTDENRSTSPTAQKSVAVVMFSLLEARELGLEGTTLPLDRVLYLLDGNVMEQDREMAEGLDRISERHCNDTTS